MAEFKMLYTENKVSRIGGRYESGSFKSLSDLVRVRLFATASGEATVSVVSFDSDFAENVVYTVRFGAGEIKFEYSFDPISLAVYKYAESFALMVTSESEYSIESITAEEEIPDTSEEESDALDNTGISESGERIVFVTDADGNKFEVERVPKRVLFIGNSLLFGMGGRYGMCSSAPDKDYYHYVTEYIKTYNPVCRFDKLYGSFYEHSENMEMFDNWYYRDSGQKADPPISAESRLTEDTDLIFIQIGDNVNTDEKETNFRSTADIFIKRIKSAAPRARLIWIHGWYNRVRTTEFIKSVCDKWGIERIDIGSIRGKATEAHSQKYYYDVNEGVQKEVSERWITHPGDLGMRKIADKIIKKLNI